MASAVSIIVEIAEIEVIDMPNVDSLSMASAADIIVNLQNTIAVVIAVVIAAVIPDVIPDGNGIDIAPVSSDMTDPTIVEPLQAPHIGSIELTPFAEELTEPSAKPPPSNIDMGGIFFEQS